MWQNRRWAVASQSHEICVADSSFSRHLLHLGLFVNSGLKRFPFRWKCPVRSPTTHCGIFLFNFNSHHVLLAEGSIPSTSFNFIRLNLSVWRLCDLCFFTASLSLMDRFCGLVVRVLGYRSGGPGSIPGTTRFSEKWVWNRVHSASWVQLRSYLIEK
jgi:hypothetical protein